MTIQFDEEKQNKKVETARREDEENLMQMLASKYGLQYVNLLPVTVNMEALRLIPETRAREARIAGFDIIGKKLDVVIETPNRQETKDAVKELENAGYEVTLYLGSMQSLEKAWSKYKDLSYAIETKAGSLDISHESINELLGKATSLKSIVTLIEEALATKKAARISHILEIIMAGAISTGASDIHLEPEETYVRLRYRLDGVLNDALNFDTSTYSLVLARVKLLSGLKLNIKNTPQDGRFSVHIGEEDIEIRTSILPGAYAESIVMRILNPKSIQVPIESLGIQPHLFKILGHQIAKPKGMILTTGPTGSGKTTTLYAFLKHIHTSDIKIITIEDPIEYHLPGIVQTQTNEKGYTFLEGLRSALRQDPDVIMVGEIRDEETAEIAINSALTGHLVFSTLHTNTAAGTFPRLIDLGVNPKIITSALNIAMAQRLVRTLCQFCKKETLLGSDNKKMIDVVVATIGSIEPIPQKEKMWTAGGCEKCNMTGYKGRVGLFEAILTSEEIERAVENDPSEREIKKVARAQGILDMRQDGILKVLAGTTSLDELSRVVDLEEPL